jgi:tetratricopeptide (TPR) repeat protein
MDWIFKGRRLAQKLHDEAEALHEQGEDDLAIAKYLAAIDAFPAGAATRFYNIGLIYKYRREWGQSLAFNQKAYALRPNDEATRWNMAIAATALHEWQIARSAWCEQGLVIPGEEGPIWDNFGSAPVRLNPEGNGEVVWGARVCPVRVRIRNIPLPDSGYCFGDVVLHDGAGVGVRKVGEREYHVFNVFEIHEHSSFSTFQLDVEVDDESALSELLKRLDTHDLFAEDWTRSIRIICSKCSEGVPHEHSEPVAETTWSSVRSIGIAAQSIEQIDLVMRGWSVEGGRTYSLRCELPAERRNMQ